MKTLTKRAQTKVRIEHLSTCSIEWVVLSLSILVDISSARLTTGTSDVDVFVYTCSTCLLFRHTVPEPATL